MPITQRDPVGDSSPEFCAGRKVTATHKALLWQLLNDDPHCPSRMVLHLIAESQVQISVTLRQINRLRKAWGLNRGQGRPRRGGAQKKSESQGHLVQVTPALSFVGVHLFAVWMQQYGSLQAVIPLLQQAIRAYSTQHPEEDFPLLHHKEQTLLLRFQALFYAPLFGIEKLTEFDVKEHPLVTLQRRSYQSTTLRQFLGHLERIEAAEALMPALLPATAGQITYVDGHMIAYWARVAMHKGKITMLGRIMAGSQAVIAHNEVGHALFVTYYPPDMHVSQVIVD
jgi:hypothetical protein